MGKTSQPEARDEIVAMAMALGVHVTDVELEILIPQAQAAAKAMCEVDGLDLAGVPPADVYAPGDE
jgi:hypothetical protein